MLSEVDVALSVLDAFFAGNSPDYPPNNAYKTLKAAVLAQQTNNNTSDEICPHFGTLPVYTEDSDEVIQWHVCKSAGKLRTS